MRDDLVTNLVVLGDNIFEMEAAKHLGKQYKEAFIKTVKFRRAPDISELQKQIVIVTQKFDTICNQAKNLTVRLLKTDEYEQAKREQKEEQEPRDPQQQKR